MDRYITLTSGTQDPADFISSFEITKDFDESYEVGVKAYYHAPTFNIIKKTKFTIGKLTSADTHTYDIENYYIEPGFYKDTSAVMKAVKDVLDKAITESRSTLLTEFIILAYKETSDQMSLQISGIDSGVKFMINMDRDEDDVLLQVLGFSSDIRLKKITVRMRDLPPITIPGFLYSNIVINSTIDQQQSRLLGLLPISSAEGYNYHEIRSPVYIPLAVQSFNEASFYLTDVMGTKVPLDHLHYNNWGVSTLARPTILLLHIRKRQPL